MKEINRLKNNNKNGYTLLELLLYMVIAVMIIGFALNMTGNTQKQFYQQVKMSELQGNGRNVIYFITKDMRNTGFKYYLDSVTGPAYVLTKIQGVTLRDDTVSTGPGTPWTTVDSTSSFYALDTTGLFNSIEFFKGSIDDNGDFDTVSRVRYAVSSDSTLKRYERIMTKAQTAFTRPTTWAAPTTMEIAENVQAFVIRYSVDKLNWQKSPVGIQSDIKAVQVSIMLKSAKTVNTTQNLSYDIADLSVAVNDKFLRRVYTEIVEIDNNGIE